jgi:hypothetical protein
VKNRFPIDKRAFDLASIDKKLVDPTEFDARLVDRNSGPSLDDHGGPPFGKRRIAPAQSLTL